MKVTCGIFIIDNNQRILTCHPTGHAVSQWDIPKGCQDEGELPIVTVARELQEETGLNLDQLHGTLYNVSETHGYFEYKHKRKNLHAFMLVLDYSFDLFHLKCSSFVEARLDRPSFPEVDSYAWIGLHEMGVLHESQRRALEVIIKNYDVFDSLYDQFSRIILPKNDLYG